MTRLLNDKKEKMTNSLCFCCKKSLNIPRNYHGDEYVYFDKHLYHTSCFLKFKMIKKKCAECKEEEYISEANGNYVYYNKKFYHKDCFIKWCHEAKKSKKREFALENIDMFVEDANELIESLLVKKHISKSNIEEYISDAHSYINKWFAGSDICALIREEYQLAKIPWAKEISPILNGTSNKTDIPIPVEDLLDMWVKKLDYLRKANQKLISRSNNKVTNESLLSYDLAILINKYGSYLRWKEKQKILEQEQKNEEVNNFILNQTEYQNIQKNISKTDNNNMDDISNLVDDIFG